MINSEKERIFIGHQYCKIYDDLNIKPCIKCGIFGNNPKKCTNEVVVCLLSAKDHTSIKCSKNNYNFVNCIYSNLKYGTQYKTSHPAFDYHNCTTLKNKIKKVIELMGLKYLLHNISPHKGNTKAITVTRSNRSTQDGT